MKTVDVRLLVHDDVDEEYLVEQLVEKANGPGSPLGAALLTTYDDSPATVSHVYVAEDTSWRSWNGDEVGTTHHVASSSRSSTSLENQVRRVQALARRLYD